MNLVAYIIWLKVKINGQHKQDKKLEWGMKENHRKLGRREIEDLVNSMTSDEVIALLEDYDIPYNSKDLEENLRKKAIAVYLKHQREDKHVH